MNGHSALQDYNGIEKGDDNGNDNITVNTVKIKDDDIIPEKESTLTINNSSELLSVPKNISDNNNIRKKLYNSINNMEKLLIFLKENNVQVSINVDIVRRCKSSIPNNKHDFHFISSEVCQVELMKVNTILHIYLIFSNVTPYTTLHYGHFSNNDILHAS